VPFKVDRNEMKNFEYLSFGLGMTEKLRSVYSQIDFTSSIELQEHTAREMSKGNRTKANLLYQQEYVTPSAGNLAEQKSRACNEISRMAVLGTIVYRLHNLLPSQKHN
jgi:hypothetical protein